MGFSGDLRTIDVAEVLQWISRGLKDGTLVIERGAVQKKVMFKGGMICSSSSNDPREHLGQFLVRSGLVSEEDLFQALLQQEREKWPLGAILVRQSALTQDELRAVLKEKAQETIFDLFLWVEGAFEFHDGQLPENLAIQITLDVTGVILEGARRADEWSRIRKVIPSTLTTFSPTGRAVEEGTEAAVLALAASGKTFAGIAMELHRSDFETAKLIYDLVRRGTLEVHARGGLDRGSDTVSAIKALARQASRALAERRFDDAVSAYEAVLLMDRLNIDARKGLLAVEEARSRPVPLPAVPLDAVPRLARDLSSLADERFDPLEGFVLSRVNGTWTVRAILKLCPVPEPDALRSFARLVQRGVVKLSER